MEISSLSEKSNKEFLNFCFEELERIKQPTKLGDILFFIGVANEYLGKEQLTNLYAFGESKNKLIKSGLIHALTGIQAHQAIKILTTLSYDKSKDIRKSAVFALAFHTNKLRKLVKETLWARLNDKESQIMEIAIIGLAKRNDPRLKEVIRIKLLEEGPAEYLITAIVELRDLELLSLVKKGDRIKEINKRVNYGEIERFRKELLKIQ